MLVNREPAQGWGREGRGQKGYLHMTWSGSTDLHKASFQPRLITLQMGTVNMHHTHSCNFVFQGVQP